MQLKQKGKYICAHFNAGTSYIGGIKNFTDKICIDDPNFKVTIETADGVYCKDIKGLFRICNYDECKDGNFIESDYD